MQIEIIEKEIGNTLIIEHTASMLKMPGLMKNGFISILNYIKEKGVEEPKDAPFACYYNIDWDKAMKVNLFESFINIFTKKWNFSIGFPISTTLAGSDNIGFRKIANKKYISCMHYGSYQAVGKTYKEMVNFSKENNFKIEPVSYEFYLNDPRVIGKEKLETRCLIPIK